MQSWPSESGQGMDFLIFVYLTAVFFIFVISGFVMKHKCKIIEKMSAEEGNQLGRGSNLLGFNLLH